ncbi:hypothetical protein [Leptospira interrogans]|uniref:hypothetical protein n=1 Tax=Leptospira interrogans TaxID=173 RepID=UPI000AF72DC2|nr:hypothetical protein [Leptospira interrogans]
MKEERLRILCALLSNPNMIPGSSIDYAIELSDEIVSKISQETVGITQNKTTE